MNKFIANAVTFFLLASFGSMTYAAKLPADLDRKEKELKIMSRIFETSLAEYDEDEGQLPGSNRPQSIYLAKQGMVFSFDFDNQIHFYSRAEWENFGRGIGHLVGNIVNEVGNVLADVEVQSTPAQAPEPPLPPQSFSDDWEREFEEKMKAYERRMEALQAMREQQAEQRQAVRELQREIRDLERQTRTLNSKDDKLETLREKLQEKQRLLKEKLDAYQRQMHEYRKKRDNERRVSAQKKSELIFSTLCDYGSTLRSIEDDEYVTLIFKRFDGKRDQFYVIPAEQVKECRDANRLAEDAVAYRQ